MIRSLKKYEKRHKNVYVFVWTRHLTLNSEFSFDPALIYSVSTTFLVGGKDGGGSCIKGGLYPHILMIVTCKREIILWCELVMDVLVAKGT